MEPILRYDFTFSVILNEVAISESSDANLDINNSYLTDVTNPKLKVRRKICYTSLKVI